MAPKVEGENKNNLEHPGADTPIEIRGYRTDPLRRGYQILWNYESIYWRALVGNNAWGLYETLRTFCHEGNDVCYPSISLLTDILGFSDRRIITGRASTVSANGKEYQYPGLIQELQQHKLVIAELEGEGPTARYIFHVNLTPGLLTEEQLSQLPPSLQKKHRELLERCEQAQRELEAKRVPPKHEKKPEGVFSEGVENFQGGVENFQGGYGNFPPEHYPYNSTQKTTSVVVEKIEGYQIDKIKAQELAAKHSPGYIAEKIEFLEWRLDQQRHSRSRRGRPITDPAGWLIRAIEKDYQPPKAFLEYKERRDEVAQLIAEEEEWRQEIMPEEPEIPNAAQEKTRREVELWEQVLKDIKLRLDPSTFKGWFPKTKLLALRDDGIAVIGVSNRMAKEWLNHRLDKLIKQSLEATTGDTLVGLEFVVLTSGENWQK